MPIYTKKKRNDPCKNDALLENEDAILEECIFWIAKKIGALHKKTHDIHIQRIYHEVTGSMCKLKFGFVSFDHDITLSQHKTATSMHHLERL